MSGALQDLADDLEPLMQQDGIDPAAYHDDVDGEIAATALKGTPIAADLLVIEDSAASNAKKRVTVGTLPIAQYQVASNLFEVASDAAVEITSATSGIALAASASGTKVITTGSSYAGQKIHIFLLAASGGSYTLVVDAGTLTLDAASECAVIQRNDANDAWFVVGLSNATIV